MAEHEVLELLLTFAIPRQDTKTLAKKLIERFGSLEAVLRAEPMSLVSRNAYGDKMASVSERTAVLLHLAGKLGKMALKPPRLDSKSIKSPNDFLDAFEKAYSHYLTNLFQSEQQEHFYIVLVNQRNQIVHNHELPPGTENQVDVNIKKIVRVCLDHHATGIFCVHNHPSGSEDFSREDIRLTETLQNALRPLDIRLLDHFLVAADRLISLRQTGLMKFAN